MENAVVLLFQLHKYRVAAAGDAVAAKPQSFLDSRLTHMLCHLADNRRYIKGILSRESGELFMGYFKERLSEVFAEHLKPAQNGVPDSYVLNHMVSSFAETVRWWLRDHPDHTPEEVASFFLAVVPIHS